MAVAAMAAAVAVAAVAIAAAVAAIITGAPVVPSGLRKTCGTTLYLPLNELTIFFVNLRPPAVLHVLYDRIGNLTDYVLDVRALHVPLVLSL